MHAWVCTEWYDMSVVGLGGMRHVYGWVIGSNTVEWRVAFNCNGMRQVKLRLLG